MARVQGDSAAMTPPLVVNMAIFSVGGIRGCPGRMCKITKLALLLWVLFFLRSGEGVTFNLSDGNLVAYEGDVLFVSCNASEGANVTWLVNGAPAEDAPGGWEVDGAALVQMNLTAGEHNGSVLSCGGAVEYLAVRSVPVISAGPQSATVNESQDIVLHCSVEGGPPLSTVWIKDDSLVPTNQSRVVQLANGSLLVTSASRQDAGEYSCRITWPGDSSTSTPANITVQYLRFLVEPVDQTVRLNQPGDAIVLNCSAEGFPLPAVSLYKGVTQVGGVTVEATQTAVSVALVIDPPGTSDAGSYSCAAENAFGRVVSQTATVYVTVPPVPAPQVDVSAVGASSFTVTWSTPADVATAQAILFYNVTVSEQDSGLVVSSAELPANASSHPVGGLQPFTGYSVRVEVRGQVNTASSSATVTTSESVPDGPPLNISVFNITNSSAIVKWEEPATPNGRVTTYHVSTSLEQLVVTSLKEVVLTGLPPLTQVSVSVAAATLAGIGPAGRTVFQTLEGVPRAGPSNLTVVRKNSTSAVLEWEELPASDLRGNLTSYTIIVYHDGREHKRLQTNRTSVVVTGLNKFALHHVQVFAETSAGQGPSSSLSLFTTHDVPGNASSVVNLTATPTGPTSIAVQWFPPMDEVFGNITGYLLTWEGAGKNGSKTVNGTNLTEDLSEDMLVYMLTELCPFTDYTIHVRVIAVGGLGAEGTPTSARTEESEPSAPQNVSAEVSGDVVWLSWQPPERPNGLLAQYEYQVVAEGGVVTGGNVSNTTLNITRQLDFFTNYTVSVWAWTGIGRGPREYTSFSTEEGPPSEPPSNVTVVPGACNVGCVANVTWSPPPMASWNGIIRGYRVNVSTDHSEEVGPDSTLLELTGLTPYTNYSVVVAAVTVIVGSFSDPTHFTTNTDNIGDSPQNVTVRRCPDNTSLLVSWQPPTMPNGPIQGYRVSWTPYPFTDAMPQYNITTMNTSQLLAGLQESTEYKVVVWARSAQFGEGPPATVEEFTSETVPVPVGIIQVLTYANEVQLSWTPPTSPIGRLRGYNVSCSRSSLPANVTEHTCEGLSPNTTYEVVITASNKFGEGSPAMETVTTACGYQTPQVAGVQFNVPFCGSSPSFKYIFVVVLRLLGDSSQRPLDMYTLAELLPPSRTRRQATSSDTSRPYVAANLTWEDLGTFQLGDGERYGGFNNAPLVAGAEYNTTIFGKRFDGMEVPFTPQTFDAPVSVPQSNVVIYVIAAIAAVLAVVLVVVVCIIVCICVSLCRAEKEEDAFGGFSRRSSFRMSFKKPKLVDPLEQFRATHPWPSLESHPPVPLSGFQSRMTVLQADSNFHFIQEYEGIVIPDEATYSTEVASSLVNAPKNRYTNIIPYEHSRVKLTSIKGVQGSDYINANYLDGFMRPKAYIAAQGPLRNTAEDFWRLVWEQQSTVIVMLTNLVERSKEKCFMYWPEGVEETYGNIDVRLDEVNVLADFTIRTFSLTRAGNQREVRQVKHFQFTAWPDHGVPVYATSMLAFVRRVQAGVQSSPDTAGPIVVHCSAGVGRSGTFIVVDSMIRRIKAGIDTLDVFGHVSLLRSQRNFMVQTEDQYFFIYEALSEYVTCGNTELIMEDVMPHMEHLGSIVEGEDSTYMELEFKHLALEKNDPHRFMSANEPCNKSKNRYVNILPFELNRVTLEPIRGVEGSDYINASFIDSYQIQGAFIASQAPLENTTEDYWRMIWQYKCPIIVMLTQLTEQGVEQCARYWPVDQPVQYGDLQVEPLVGRHTPTYSYREFSLTHSKGDSAHTVRHFHFHCWPEVGVPSTGIPLVELIREVTKMYNQLGSLRPIVVHCSSGVGRTGVFIALNIILERMKLEGVVDVFQTVKMLRIQRPAMVQTLEQYQFCYDTTMEVLSRYDSFKSLLRNTSKARTAQSDVSTFLPTTSSSDANFTGTADDGHPPSSSPFPDSVA